jgi:hypothetical protein
MRLEIVVREKHAEMLRKCATPDGLTYLNETRLFLGGAAGPPPDVVTLTYAVAANASGGVLGLAIWSWLSDAFKNRPPKRIRMNHQELAFKKEKVMRVVQDQFTAEQ